MCGLFVVNFTQIWEMIFLFLLSGYVDCTVPSLAGITQYTHIHIHDVEESSWYRWTRWNLLEGARTTFSQLGTLLSGGEYSENRCCLKTERQEHPRTGVFTNAPPSLSKAERLLFSAEGWSLPEIFLPFWINGNNSVMRAPLLYAVSSTGQNTALGSSSLCLGWGEE